MHTNSLLLSIIQTIGRISFLAGTIGLVAAAIQLIPGVWMYPSLGLVLLFLALEVLLVATRGRSSI